MIHPIVCVCVCVFFFFFLERDFRTDWVKRHWLQQGQNSPQIVDSRVREYVLSYMAYRFIQHGHTIDRLRAHAYWCIPPISQLLRIWQ